MTSGIDPLQSRKLAEQRQSGRELKVRQEMRALGRPERHNVLSFLVLFGLIIMLYVAAWVFVFSGPLGQLVPGLWPWIPNYVAVGLVFGLTLFPRLWVRRRLDRLSWKLKSNSKPWGPPGRSFGLLSGAGTFGYTTGAMIVVFMVVWTTIAHTVAWVLTVPIEVGLWTEYRGK